MLHSRGPRKNRHSPAGSARSRRREAFHLEKRERPHSDVSPDEMPYRSLMQRIMLSDPRPAGRRRAGLKEISSDRLQVGASCRRSQPRGRGSRPCRASGDQLDGLHRDPVVVLALREVEQRHHRAGLAAFRVFRDDRLISASFSFVKAKLSGWLSAFLRRCSSLRSHQKQCPATR